MKNKNFVQKAGLLALLFLIAFSAENASAGKVMIGSIYGDIFSTREEINKKFREDQRQIDAFLFDNKHCFSYTFSSAIKNKKMDCVAFFITIIKDVNAKNWKEGSPLHHVAKRGHAELTALLITNGADVNGRNHEGWTPLHYAVWREHTEVTSLLIKNGADVNAKIDGPKSIPFFRLGTSLHLAAQKNNTEIIALLIENGADVNAKERWEYTPLHIAAQEEHFKSIALLIENGADVNAKTWQENTPLHFVNNIEIIAFLIKNGANINAKNIIEQQPDLGLPLYDFKIVYKE